MGSPDAALAHAQPLRIVIVTDIHACRPWMPPDRIHSIVEKANRLDGDIIVVLGDFVSGIGERSSWAASRRAEWGAALAEL